MIARYLCMGCCMGLSACTSEREEVPGSVKPGSIEEVTSHIDGYAGSHIPLDAIGIVPPYGGHAPAIPLVRSAQVISFFIFPRKSRDGLSYREGVWVHRVIKAFSWGVDEVMHDDRLMLSSLGALRLDEQGQLVGLPGSAGTASVEAASSAPGVPSAGQRSQGVPWREATVSPAAAQTRTTVIYPSSGTQVSTTTPSGSTPAYINSNGAVNLQEVQRAMQEAQTRVRELQQSRSQTGLSASALPTTLPTLPTQTAPTTSAGNAAEVGADPARAQDQTSGAGP